MFFTHKTSKAFRRRRWQSFDNLSSTCGHHRRPSGLQFIYKEWRIKRGIREKESKSWISAPTSDFSRGFSSFSKISSEFLLAKADMALMEKNLASFLESANLTTRSRKTLWTFGFFVSSVSVAFQKARIYMIHGLLQSFHISFLYFRRRTAGCVMENPFTLSTFWKSGMAGIPFRSKETLPTIFGRPHSRVEFSPRGGSRRSPAESEPQIEMAIILQRQRSPTPNR